MDKPVGIIELCHDEKYAFVVLNPHDNYGPEFHLWNVPGRTCINKKYVDGSGRVVSFKVVDDREALIECRTKTMRWDPEKGIYDVKQQEYLNEADWEITGTIYYEPSLSSPDGYRKFSWSEDRKTLHILDGENEDLITHIKHSEPICVAAFHPYARLIVWAGEDNFIRLWNLEEDKLIVKWEIRNTLTACTVTGEGLIIGGDRNGNVYFVDTPFVPGRVIDHKPDHKNRVADAINRAGNYKDKVVGFFKEKVDNAREYTSDMKNRWRR